MSNQTTPAAADALDDEDYGAVYGEAMENDNLDIDIEIQKKQAFLPWHHPVKQVVRDRQWLELTIRLIESRQLSNNVLRYFTLPGSDLLDVRVLADDCKARGVKIEYFGFNSGYTPQDQSSANTSWVTAESALRQSEKITDNAVILRDRLEDIAINNSQAANQLSLREPFDVVNIDACDNLSYRPDGRDVCTFDALHAMLRHQMTARRPWLLFLTTRVDPALLGQPGLEFNRAITENLRISPQDFGSALAGAIDADLSLLQTALSVTWTQNDEKFLKLYTIGVGKFLLQFFHAQPNLPAKVELASAYAYRVWSSNPDMLALAFRISPESPRAFAPNVGGAAATPLLEPERAVRVVARALKLQDLDRAMETETDLRNTAIQNTEKLLKSANYDEIAWRGWLSEHPQRPMQNTISEPTSP